MRWKKLTIVFCIAAVAFPALVVPTKRAEAFFGCTPVPTPPPTPLGPFVPAYDAATAIQQSFTNIYNSSVFQKQCILDGLVKILAKSLINNLTGSIVDWINKDFQGGPAFITNPAGFFVNIADETAGNFIETQLGPIGQLLCSPFDLRLRLNLWLATGASRKQYLGCRLTNIQKDAYEAFTNGGFIANGGWRTFNALTSDPRNNQYGAFIYASDALNTEFIKKANEKLRELSYGRGFLSYKKCTAYSVETNATGGHDCAQYQTLTPGSIIESQLGNALGTDLRQYELADNFNAILGAVVNYGLRQVFSSGGGLLSASSQNAGGASPSAQRLREGDFSALYALSNESDPNTGKIRTVVGDISKGEATVTAVGAAANVTSTGLGNIQAEQNLALRKPARQSSDWRETIKNTNYVTLHEAKLAVDDNSGGWYSAAITNDGNREWWTVDLEQSQLIGRVEIYQDPDRQFSGCLIVSKTPFGSSPLTCVKSTNDTVQKFAISPSAIRPIVITMQANTEGRYLWIQSETNDNLILLEVKAFAPSGNNGSTQGVGRSGTAVATIGAVQPQDSFRAGDTYTSTLTLSTNGVLENLTLTATLKKLGSGAIPFSTVFSSFKVTSKDFIKNTTNSITINTFQNNTSVSNISLKQNAAATVGYVGVLRGGPNESWRSAGIAPGNYIIFTELKNAGGTVLETNTLSFTVN